MVSWRAVALTTAIYFAALIALIAATLAFDLDLTIGEGWGQMPSAWWMLLAAIGNMHESLGNWEFAKRDYQQLLELDDRNVLGLNNLAYLLTDKLGRPAEAASYARSATLLTANPTVHDTLAWTQVQLGEYQKAIAGLTRILEENPTFVAGIYHLAEAYRRKGDLAKAGSVLTGAENLLADGVAEDFADNIRKCRTDIEKGNSTP